MIALKPPLSITILFRVRQTKKKERREKKEKKKVKSMKSYFILGLDFSAPPSPPLPLEKMRRKHQNPR